MDTPLVSGHVQLLTIIDECRRYRMTNPMKKEADAFEVLLSFVVLFEKRSDHTIKAINCDKALNVWGPSIC